jgi:hypothetical protein
MKRKEASKEGENEVVVRTRRGDVLRKEDALHSDCVVEEVWRGMEMWSQVYVLSEEMIEVIVYK